MSSHEFCEGFLKHLNAFRKSPTSISKKMETFRLGLTRLKSRHNSQLDKSIQKFASTLKKMSPCKEMELNEKLCESCEKYINSKDPNNTADKFMVYGDTLKGVVPDEYLNEDCFLFYDDSASDPEIFLIKILINKEDTEQLGVNLLRNNGYTQVGISYRPKEEDGNMVVIFAKNKVEEKQTEEIELPEGDLSELKQAFDLFDVQEIGQISPKETVEAMKAINFNEKNPELFKIMENLQDQGEMVDFPTFAWHIVGSISNKDSKPGLQTIFNLYVDDFDQETISLTSLKKICRNLGEKESEREVEDLINSNNSGARLNFNDFYSFMKEKKRAKRDNKKK